MSLQTTYDLLPGIKTPGTVVVSESGITDRSQCQALEDAGVDDIICETLKALKRRVVSPLVRHQEAAIIKLKRAADGSNHRQSLAASEREPLKMSFVPRVKVDSNSTYFQVTQVAVGVDALALALLAGHEKLGTAVGRELINTLPPLSEWLPVCRSAGIRSLRGYARSCTNRPQLYGDEDAATVRAVARVFSQLLCSIASEASGLIYRRFRLTYRYRCACWMRGRQQRMVAPVNLGITACWPISPSLTRKCSCRWPRSCKCC